MKKIIIVACALFGSVSLMAQNPTTLEKEAKAKAKETKTKQTKAKAEGKEAATLELTTDGTKAISLKEANAAEVVKPTQKDIATVVKFSELKHEFGKIPQGKPVEFDVTLTNISKDTITIVSVVPQCGCTTPKYTPGAKYAPGQSFKVTLGYNAATLGHFTKGSTFNFNDGLSQLVSFEGETFAVAADAAPANEAAGVLKPGK